MNKDSKLLFEAYKAIKENKLQDMTPEEREAYEAKLDKEEAYDASLLAHDSEEAENNSLVPPEEFIRKILNSYRSSFRSYYEVYFGKMTEGERAGQMYALVNSSEEYSDGDRWMTDDGSQLFFNKLSDRGYFETSNWLNTKQAEEWKNKSLNEFPELNKHIS